MVRILQLLFSLIGYLCTATVITLALGAGYLWHSDRLNDEKVFRIVALLHDVDLHQLSQTQQATDEEIPPEELSLEQVMRQQQVFDRNSEVKLLALQRGRQEYDHRLQQLKEQTDRYDRLVQDSQALLNRQEDAVAQENIAKVVRHLEQVKPATAKELLMRSLEENRMDEVITLMSRMAENKMSKILLTFETDPELDQLHEIHQRILGGGPETSGLEQAINGLNAADTAE